MDDGNVCQQKPVPFYNNYDRKTDSTIAPAVYPPMSHWVRITGLYIPSFNFDGGPFSNANNL